MERLKLELRKIADRVDELSLRERAIIFVGVLATMYIVADRMVIQRLAEQRTRLSAELKTKRDQIQSTERQIQTILSGDVTETDPVKRQQLDSLRQQVKTVEGELSNTTSGLVVPKEMARLVERYLSSQRGVQVVKVESLPPQPVTPETPSPAGATPGAAPAAAVSIFKHGTRIELRGSYLDLVEYLQGLERQPWKVFWAQASFQTEKYPSSKLTLVIYTLSTKESWIGI